MGEPQALTQLAFDEVGRGVGGIAGMHRAIAERAFAALGSGGAPARVLHDAISAGVYGAVHGGTVLAGRGAAVAVGATSVDRAELSARARGAGAIAVLNGLVGDQLEREESALAAPMAVRVGGRAVAAETGALAAAFPEASPRLVVFVHGLMETEFAWRLGESEPYATRLEDDLGVTAVEVRYNTGRHVSENGASLAALMDELVAAWPVDVEQIALVGHSMGGLVARSACHQATVAAASVRASAARAPSPTTAAPIPPADAPRWAERVRQVVSLGSPHLGAPLAQGVHWAAAALDALPETRSFGGLLRRRSAGIRDLRHGSLVDEDWRDRHPDALRARACAEVPLLPGATHCFVTATVTASPRHPLGRLLGDALVLVPSGAGRDRTRRIGFRAEDGLHVGGAHHLALLNHPAVYERLRDWLAG